MKTRTLFRSVVLCGAAASLATAQDVSFKAYGFADAKLTQQWYEENNFLRQQGIVTPDAQFNVEHVNTYLDWKPNGNVRFLAEVGFNRNPNQVSRPGTRAVFDSASVYSNVYGQIGASARASALQALTAAYPTLSAATLGAMADSSAQASVAKTVNTIGNRIRSQAATNLTKTPKDHGIVLPRAQMDLLLKDEVNFRVGRFITPSGIWNVDHGSPAILTIAQPTQTAAFPIFPESQTGVEVFGKIAVGDQDLSYATWVSTGRGGFNVLGGADYGQDPQNLDDWAWGTHLQGDFAVLDGIRLGGTFHTGTIREDNEVTELPVVGFDVATSAPIFDYTRSNSVTTSMTYARELCYGLDTKIEWNHFLLQGEWNHRKILNLQLDSKETNFDGWYILLSRSFPLTANASVSPYAMYEWIGWDGAANNPAFGLAGIPIDGFGSWIGGLNFSLYSRYRIKLEYLQLVPSPYKIPNADYETEDLVAQSISAQFSVAF